MESGCPQPFSMRETYCNMEVISSCCFCFRDAAVSHKMLIHCLTARLDMFRLWPLFSTVLAT